MNAPRVLLFRAEKPTSANLDPELLNEQAEDRANLAELQRRRPYAAQFIGQLIDDQLHGYVPPLPSARTPKAVV